MRCYGPGGAISGVPATLSWNATPSMDIAEVSSAGITHTLFEAPAAIAGNAWTYW